METKEQTVTAPPVRRHNYGLDFWRTFSAFCMLFLHTAGRAEILEKSVPGTFSYYFWWFLVILFYVGNNYILASGYTGYTPKEKKQDWSKVVMVWMQAVFYSVAGYIVFSIYLKDPLEPLEFVKSFFPMSNITEYWFVTSYIGLSILRPSLDKALRNTGEEDLKKLIPVLLVLFSVYSIFSAGTDPFHLTEGYSVIWFIVLYLLGGIIRKCRIDEKFSAKKAILIQAALVAVTFLWKNFGFSFHFIRTTITPDSLIKVTSPTILCASLMQLIVFSKMKFSDTFNKVFSITSASVLACYLINTHPLYINRIVYLQLASWTSKRISSILPRLGLYMILFFAVSVLVENCRAWLFKKLKIQALVRKIVRS